MKRKNSEHKRVLKFLSYLKKLETVEAIGVAKLLGIDTMESQVDLDAAVQEMVPKDEDVILAELIDAFVAADKKKQDRLLWIMKDATR